MITKLRIEKVANGYIVTEPVDQGYVFNLSDAHVFYTLYEVYQYLEKVMGVQDEQ